MSHMLDQTTYSVGTAKLEHSKCFQSVNVINLIKTGKSQASSSFTYCYHIIFE